MKRIDREGEWVSSPPLMKMGEVLAWWAWMLRPVLGLDGRTNVVPTTYVVAYYLSPYGLVDQGGLG